MYLILQLFYKKKLRDILLKAADNTDTDWDNKAMQIVDLLMGYEND